MRTLSFCMLATALHAASIETTLLGRITSSGQILTASDRQGSMIVAASNPPCGFLQDVCPPITVAKLGPDGKVVWRRGIGEPSWRFFPTALAVDPAGNIVIGGTTADPNLPVMRPVQQRLAGATDVYLFQLNADGTRTTFATYVGGNGPEELSALRAGPNGEIVAVVQTAGGGFPFSAQVGPALPPGNTRWNALVRIVPSTGVLSYALGSPFTGIPPDVAITSAGVARWVVPDLTPGMPVVPPGASILDVQPDGTRSRSTTALPPQASVLRAYPSPDGGLWFTGILAGGAVPTTANAFRRTPSTFTYVRLEDQQRVTPGPIQGVTVRLLAVDSADRNRIFAATSGGLYRSDDNGWNWTEVNASPNFRNVIAMASGAGRLWVATPAPQRPLLAFSDDAGSTWTEVALPAAAGSFNLVAHPTERSAVFLGAGLTFYATRDSGETWNQRQFPFPIIELTVDPSAPDTVALTTIAAGNQTGPPSRTVYFSDDGGRNFPRNAMVPISSGGFPTSLQFDPSEPGRIYYTTDGLSLFRTTKDTFPQSETLRLPFGLIVRFGFQTGAPGVIFAMSPDSSLHRSADGGRTWTLVSQAPPRSVFPQQMVIGAGGVVHVAQPSAPESFVAKAGARGELVYLSYLGVASVAGPGPGEASGVIADAAGRVTLVGLTNDPDFPGEKLRGDASGLPPNLPPFLDAPNVFALSLAADGALLGSAVLAGTLQETLFGAASGPDASVLLLGITGSPDFPGLGSQKVDPMDAPSVFFSRLRQ